VSYLNFIDKQHEILGIPNIIAYHEVIDAFLFSCSFDVFPGAASLQFWWSFTLRRVCDGKM